MADVSDADRAEAEELARRGLRWLLRGGTWQALAREVAWAAVQSAGVSHTALEWLTPLIEARLAEEVDGLEFVVDMSAVRARCEHVRRRPHDRHGAEVAAAAEGYAAAIERLSRRYVQELEWAVDLLAERVDRGRRGGRHSPFAVRSRRPPQDFTIPRDVADELAGSERAGRPRRSAA